MKYLWQEEHGVFNILGSPHITSVIDEAKDLATVQNRTVRFEFNDVVVSVDKESDPELVKRDFFRALKHCINRYVGPRPDATLSDVTQMEDKIISAIWKRRWNEVYAKQFSVR